MVQFNKFVLGLALILSVPMFFYGQESDYISQKVFSQEQREQLFLEYEPIDEIRVSVAEELAEVKFLAINRDFFTELLNEQNSQLELTIPLSFGDIQVELKRQSIFAGRPNIKTASGQNVERTFENCHYWGKVKGAPHSSVAISIMETGVMGIINYRGTTYEIAELNQHEDIYTIYDNADLKLANPFDCHVTKEHELFESSAQKESGVNNPDNCVQVYVEVDHLIFLDKNSSVLETANYVEGAFSQVFILYDNESINMAISELVIWDTPDPYTGPSSGDYLGQFRNANAGNYNGDIAHLVSYGGGGGVAYLDVLCSQFWGFAYSGIGSSYNDVPAYSWTVSVIAHEIGHNIGSRHTHACAWNGNNSAIDGCGPTAGYSEGCDAPLPAAGTVMSYCHLLGSVGIDLGEGFHPQVGDLFQDKVYPSTCLTTCYESPEAAIGMMESLLCPGSSMYFWDASTGDVVDWDWSFTGGSPSSSNDPNPVVTYSTPGFYNVTLEVTSSTGETSTTTLIAAVEVQPSGGDEYLIYEDFEEGLGDWVVENPGGGISWELTNDAFGTRYGNQSLWIDNYNNGVGQNEILVSPQISLLAYNTAQLHIEYSYATFSGTSDSLVIEYSIDGGNSFRIAESYYENGNGNFATTVPKDFSFVPFTEDEWCYSASANNCIVADLSGATRQHEVVVRIRNKSLGGNNLFIDRVWIAADCYDLAPPLADFTSDILGGCAPVRVEFTDVSSGYPLEWEWFFPGGTPSFSTLQNPIITYERPGIYEVSLTAINPEGSTNETKAGYIIVDTVPIADFDYSVSGQTVTFTSLAMNGGTYTWDFGDGNTSNEANPMHTYDEDGVYQVQLSVSNPCGSNTVTKTVQVLLLPNAIAEYADSIGCVPMSISFNANTSEYTDSFYWQFEGGSPRESSLANPVVTYDTAGTYDVILIAQNSLGYDTLLIEDAVEIIDSTYADFNYTSNGLDVVFTNQTQVYDSLIWIIQDSIISTSSSFQYGFGSTGTYSVTLIALNSYCGNDTLSQNLEVWAQPTASFEADIMSGCVPLNVRLQSNSMDAESYVWLLEGASPDSAFISSPSVRYETPGVYDITLIVSNPTGADTLLMPSYIEVYANPLAAFDFEAEDLEVSFENQSEYATSYYWDFGDGNSSTEVSPTHLYSSEGSYTVQLIAINDCDSISFSRNVNTGNVPKANFNAQGSLTGCAPYEITFVDQSTGNVEGRLWSFDGGIPAQSTDSIVTVRYEQAGLFDVVLTVENAAGENSFGQSDFVTIVRSAQGDIEYDINQRSVSFDGIILGDSVVSHYWDFGDGNSSFEEDPQHEYVMDGDYSVIYVVSNNCSSDTSSVDLSISTVSTETNSVSGYRLYPNPFAEVLFIDSELADFEVLMYDMHGKLYKRNRSQGNQLRIETNDLPSGAYIIEIIQEKKNHRFKVIRQ